jgi:DNA-binding winged helix-turn-helix (wHTH) protein
MVREPPDPPRTLSFGPFCFDTDSRLLTRDGVAVRLPPKAAEVLLALVRANGQLVPKDALVSQVWPSTFVDDGSLTFHIHLVRQALGDDAVNPTYIETLPRRGYRFIAIVSVVVEDSGPAAAAPAPIERFTHSLRPAEHTSVAPEHEVSSEPQHKAGWRWGAVLAATVAAIAVAIMADGWRPEPFARVARVTQLTFDGGAKQSLVLLDDSHLLLYNEIGSRILALDTGRIQDSGALDMYRVLDVSRVRGEALAVRPRDAGAEEGLWAVSLDGVNARRLAAAQTTADAAWSHDGRRIAFHDQHTVYVSDAGGRRVKSVASFTGEPTAVSWKLDDGVVRVHVANVSDRTVGFDLYDIDVAAADAPTMMPRQFPWLLKGYWLAGSHQYLVGCGTVSVMRVCSLREAGLLFPSEMREIEPPEAIRDAGKPRAYSVPVPSTDGTRVYVIGATGPELSRYDAIRKQFEPYLRGISAFAVEFSRDRRRVAYIRHPELTLWVARADGTEPRQLIGAPSLVDAAAWSPNGDLIAVRLGAPGKHYKIHLVRPEGGIPEPLDPRDVEQGSPTWSPDGRTVAFGDVPERYGKAMGSERIHLYDVATRSASVVPHSDGLWSSRWSPDGRYLAATRIVDRRLMLFTFATNSWQELDALNVADLMWSPDSQFIYCDPEPRARWAKRVRVIDGTVEPVVDLGAVLRAHHGAGISREGAPLFLHLRSDVYAWELARR